MTDEKAMYPNRAFLRAYLNGRKARLAGSARVTPYKDHRTFRGDAAGKKQTFSRGFIAAWYRGYDDEAREGSPNEGRLL